VDRDDARVVERGGGLRFEDESIEAVLVGGGAFSQNLDGDFAAETRVLRAIDRAHSAFA
jgi:hypothetical protein